jgi:RNA polymerase sigma factor for flagellar operon FliA
MKMLITITPPADDPPASCRRPVTYQPTSHDIREHMHLVYKVVSQLQRRVRRSVSRDDLVAAGMTGLLDAIRKNNGEVGSASFEAYAMIRIRGAIIDEMRLLDWSPRRTKANGAAGGADASGAVIPRVQINVVRFEDMPPTSEPATPMGSPEQQVDEAQTRRALATAFDALPDRERRILELRYFQDVPSKEIAAMLGVSEARISQLHTRATTTLRGQLVQIDEKRNRRNTGSNGNPPSLFPPPAAQMRKAA